MKIGILGGSFDPVHYGHLLLAQYALEELELDGVLFMPAKQPPHKEEDSVSSFEHRTRMLELAFGGREDFLIGRTEEDREGPSYTYDTLSLLKKEDPETDYVFLIGADSLMSLEKWYRAKELISQFSFAIAPRPGKRKEEIRDFAKELEQKYASSLRVLDSPYIEISSTACRARAREGKSLLYHVPKKVREYIEEKKLYQKG